MSIFAWEKTLNYVAGRLGQKEDHGLLSSVDASSALSGAKTSQTQDLVWVTGEPLETIFVKTFFQNICKKILP